MIRTAQPPDIPVLLGMGRRFHGQSGQPMAFDAVAVEAMISGMIQNDAATVLMTDRGMICGALAPAYCDPSWIMAIELAWWAEGDGLALLRGFEAWAQESGAREVRMTTLSALPRASAIMRRRGYAASEISHSKVL